MKKWEELPEELQLKEVREYYDALQLHQGGLLAKRIFDIIVSGILLVLVSPILFVLSILIKILRDQLCSAKFELQLMVKSFAYLNFGQW